MAENKGPRLLNLVRELPATVPFVGPETQERVNGETFAARIGANENVFGPSPNAMKAMQDACESIWKYADPENHDLIHALAHFHGVTPENIAVGEGIDGLLGYTARMFIEPGVDVVTSLGSYPTFNFHINGYGGKLNFVPYVNDHEDTEGLIEKTLEVRPSLLYFSNPNNPMGTWWPAERVSTLIEQVPEETVLILDEAYIEAAPTGTAPAIDVGQPNLLRFRTFSKAYGMAGARVGYVIGHPDLIGQYDKIRNHFGMNRAAQIAALAALEDQAYLEAVCQRIARARERIYEIARNHNASAIPSATNFVAVDCGRDAAFAKSILDRLVSRGVFVRMPGVEPQSRCIRVSVGTDENLDMFEREFAAAMKELR